MTTISWILYAIDVFSSIRHLLLIVGFIAVAVTAARLAAYYLFDLTNIPPTSSFLTKMSVVAFSTFFIATLLPSRQTMYMMFTVEIANTALLSPTATMLSEPTVRYLNTWIESRIRELAPNTQSSR